MPVQTRSRGTKRPLANADKPQPQAKKARHVTGKKVVSNKKQANATEVVTAPHEVKEQEVVTEVTQHVETLEVEATNTRPKRVGRAAAKKGTVSSSSKKTAPKGKGKVAKAKTATKAKPAGGSKSKKTGGRGAPKKASTGKKATTTTSKKAGGNKKATVAKGRKGKEVKKQGQVEVNKAPDFSCKDENGKEVKLSDFSGKYLVLYFYPKDSTPGCTKEGCRFRDLKSEFDGLNAVIYGVSADSEASHTKFIEKQKFNFSLLADTDRTLIKAFGAGNGSKIVRSTFLINPEGNIVFSWNPVKGAATHPDQVLAKLQEVSGSGVKNNSEVEAKGEGEGKEVEMENGGDVFDPDNDISEPGAASGEADADPMDVDGGDGKETEAEDGLEVGNKAPAFCCRNEKGEQVSLSDFSGKNLVLYFYPKDATSGCTKEGCRFRDLKSEFDGLNCEILGVSADSEASHTKFIEKQKFNFSLLADTDRTLIKAYDAAKGVKGIKRCTYLMNGDGKIGFVWKSVRGADKHPDQVLEKLQEISQQ